MTLRSVPLLLLVIASACAHARSPSGARDVLRVSGSGHAGAQPDQAVLSVGVEALAKELPPALRDADERMRAVAAALAGAGVAATDVRTTRYDVALERPFDPKRGGPGEPTGYRVVHELRVVVRGGDAARAGAALDAAVRAGANVVHSLSFEKEDLSAERARALEAAVAEARAKAEALARAAGRTLGPAVVVTEAEGGPIPVVREMRVAAVAVQGAPLQAGELDVQARVEVEFALR